MSLKKDEWHDISKMPRDISGYVVLDDGDEPYIENFDRGDYLVNGNFYHFGVMEQDKKVKRFMIFSLYNANDNKLKG